MKKICKKCGRNRKIGKFGIDYRNNDGKRIYCRDCIKEYNKLYKNTHAGNVKHKKSVENWKNKNKISISNYNKEYYKKNRRRILYDKKCREETESVLIFEDDVKVEKKKNKTEDKYNIIINPKRKKQ